MVGHLSSFFQKKRAAREENGDDCNSHGAALFSTMETKNEKKSAPKWPSRASPRSRKKSQVFFWNEGKALFGGCPGRTRRIWCVVVFFFAPGRRREHGALDDNKPAEKSEGREREEPLFFFHSLFFLKLLLPQFRRSPFLLAFERDTGSK